MIVVLIGAGMFGMHMANRHQKRMEKKKE